MRIAIEGCDDTTYIDEDDWGMCFSLEEIEIIGKLADLSEKKSEYQCQPIIRIEDEDESSRTICRYSMYK